MIDSGLLDNIGGCGRGPSFSTAMMLVSACQFPDRDFSTGDLARLRCPESELVNPIIKRYRDCARKWISARAIPRTRYRGGSVWSGAALAEYVEDDPRLKVRGLLGLKLESWIFENGQGKLEPGPHLRTKFELMFKNATEVAIANALENLAEGNEGDFFADLINGYDWRGMWRSKYGFPLTAQEDVVKRQVEPAAEQFEQEKKARIEEPAAEQTADVNEGAADPADEQAPAAKIIPFPKKIPMPKRSHMRGLMVAVSFCLVFTFAAAARRGFDNVFAILETSDKMSALEFLVDDSNEIDALYAAAWTYFNLGQYDKARGLSEKLIERDDLTDSMQGQIYYVLGGIDFQVAKPMEALASFRIAEKAYTRAGSKEGLFRTRIEKIRALHRLDEHDHVDELLTVLNPEVVSERTQSEYFKVASLVFMERGQYSESLKHSKAWQRTTPSTTAMAFSHARVAALYLLKGDLQRGLSESYHAKALAARLKDPRLRTYNLVNDVAQGLLTGADTTPLETLIIEYAEEHDETRLIQLLELVKSRIVAAS